MNDVTKVAVMIRAFAFSAWKHVAQRRKDADASPYINHPIDVVDTLANVGDVTDITTLVAAALHDTIEDTRTTAEEIEERFGRDVRQLVEEVTDDKSLPKTERKRLQVEHASRLSDRAKLIKLADKISNVQDVTHHPPSDCSLDRRIEYFDWAEAVVAGCRGQSEALERRFDEVVAMGREQVVPKPVQNDTTHS